MVWRFPCFPHRSRHLGIQGRKNRLYLQVITFRKDPSLALKNLPITPNPAPAQIWGGWAMGAATEGCPPPPPRCRALLLEKRSLWAPGSLGGWVHLGVGCSHWPTAQSWTSRARALARPSGQEQQGPGPAPPMVPSRSRGWEDWLGPRTQPHKASLKSGYDGEVTLL